MRKQSRSSQYSLALIAMLGSAAVGAAQVPGYPGWAPGYVPGYPPAMELRKHLGELLLDPAMHGYTPILGLPALREHYAAHLSGFYGAPITAGHLALHGAPTPRPAVATTDLRVAERQAIEKALRETDGNKAKTARRLGLTRTQLYVRLRKYDIESTVA